MLAVEKSIALYEAVQQMGFDSIEDFALSKAKEKLLCEIETCTNNIEKFEKKYGFDSLLSDKNKKLSKNYLKSLIYIMFRF